MIMCQKTKKHRPSWMQALALIFALATLFKSFWGYFAFRRMNVGGFGHRFSAAVAGITAAAQGEANRKLP